MQEITTEVLKEKARWVREITLKMITKAGSGHPGGSMSEVELLVALYYKYMKLDPENPKWPERDRFILSKGHCCPPLYAILSDIGFFPKDTLFTLRQYGSLLQGHPSVSTPGIESVSGSLGNGLSIGTGMAMAGRKKQLNYHVYVLLGDGELQEGCIWEAAMCAAHHKLNTITAIVDRNRLQINGAVDNIVGVEPLQEKWESFGWNTLRINGHDFDAISTALETVFDNDKPTVIIADTVKGKGISFMEDNYAWHGGVLTEEQLNLALAELEAEK